MTKKKKTEKIAKIRKTPFVVIFFFLFMGCAGIAFEEPRRVLELATQICLSCIGIG